MSFIKAHYPHCDWEWRNVFIKLSDIIGEKRNPTVEEIRDISICEDYLLMKYKDKLYPLRHKATRKKDYLFYIEAGFLYFKTYEGEPYLDKYGRWWNK